MWYFQPLHRVSSVPTRHNTSTRNEREAFEGHHLWNPWSIMAWPAASPPIKLEYMAMATFLAIYHSFCLHVNLAMPNWIAWRRAMNPPKKFPSPGIKVFACVGWPKHYNIRLRKGSTDCLETSSIIIRVGKSLRSSGSAALHHPQTWVVLFFRNCQTRLSRSLMAFPQALHTDVTPQRIHDPFPDCTQIW